MDFTNFINSKDIRDYHREIGYQYNSLEAAWLVSQCHRKTLEQKHDAWKWIIDNLPDYAITNVGKWHPLKGESVHKMLADYMDMQDQFIAEFKDETGGWFYSYTSHSYANNSFDSKLYEGFTCTLVYIFAERILVVLKQMIYGVNKYNLLDYSV